MNERPMSASGQPGRRLQGSETARNDSLYPLAEQNPVVIALGHRSIQCEQLAKSLILGPCREPRSTSVCLGEPIFLQMRTSGGLAQHNAASRSRRFPAEIRALGAMGPVLWLFVHDLGPDRQTPCVLRGARRTPMLFSDHGSRWSVSPWLALLT